jgi:hypothetical protein
MSERNASNDRATSWSRKRWWKNDDTTRFASLISFHAKHFSKLHQSLFCWCHENDIKRKRIDWLSDRMWNYFEFSEINVAFTNNSSQFCTFCAATRMISHST